MPYEPLQFLTWLQNQDPDKDYHYFDTPDGNDCVRKVWYLSKYSALAGIAFSAFDVSLYSHPIGVRQTAFRFGYWMFPMICLPATYASVTCIATNIRGKDDYWNHGFGGLAAGYVWGAIRGSIAGGSRAALALAVLGMLVKHDRIENLGLFVDIHPHQQVGNIRTPKADYSLYKEPPNAKEEARRLPWY